MTEVKNSDFELKRRDYFVGLALSHVPEMRLLREGGKINKPEGWKTAWEHSVVVTAVMHTLCGMIGTDKPEAERLTRAAAAHDWDKRLELRSSDFSQEDINKALGYLAEVNPDKKLLKVTKMDYIISYFQGRENPSLSEKMMYYADGIVSWNKIIKYDDRIDELAKRNDDYHNDEIIRLVGGNVADKEKEMGHKFEKDIFDALPKEVQKKVDIPENLPMFIRATIESQY